MPTEIEALQLTVKNEVNSAVSGLDKLAGSVEKLKSATSGTNLTALATDLHKIAIATATASTSKETLTALADSLTKLGKINGDNLATVATGVKSITDTVSAIPTTATEPLSSLATVVERLAATKSGVSSLDKLMGSLKAADPDKLISVSDALAQMALQVAPFAESADALSKAASAIGRLNKADFAQLAIASGSLNSLITSVSRLRLDYVENLERMARAVTALAQAGSVLNHLRNAKLHGGAGDTGSKKSGEGSRDSTLSILGRIKLAAKAVGQAIKEIPYIGRIVEGAEKWLPIFGKVASFAGKMSWELTKGIYKFSGLKKAVGSLTGGFKKAYSKAGQFFSAIKRIATYRLMRAAIKAITQALREGIKNLYEYSRVVGTQFYKSMDMLATSALYLKNSLAAAASPVINALAPAIDILVDKFVSLINYVNQFFAAFTGKEVWTMAKKVPTAFNSAEESAKNTADAIKSWTVGIDELNIIEDKADSGSGSPGNALDYSSMFEEREVESSVSDLAAKLKEQFANQDWNALGTTIGTKLNEAVAGINWTQLGTTIGGKIGGIITTLNATEKTFDFTELGTKVGNGLTSMVEEIKWGDLGSLMMGLFVDSIDLLAGFVDGVNWESIGNAIHDFITGFFNRFTSWVNGNTLWSNGKNGFVEAGKGLWQKLKDFVTGLKFEEIADAFFEALGAALGAGVATVLGVIQGIGADIQAHFDKYLLNEDGTKKTGAAYIAGIVEAMQAGVQLNLGENLQRYVVEPFGRGFMSKLNPEMETAGTEAVKSTTKGMTDRAKAAATKKALTLAEQQLADPFSKMPGQLAAVGTEAASAIVDASKPTAAQLKKAEDSAATMAGKYGQTYDAVLIAQGGAAMLGLQQAIAAKSPGLENFMAARGTALGSAYYATSGTQSLYERFKSFGTKVLNAFDIGSRNKSGTVSKSLGKISTDIGTAFYNQGGSTSLYTRMKGFGTSVLNAFDLGGKSKQSAVEKDYGAFASGFGTAFYNQGGNTSLYTRMKGFGTSVLNAFDLGGKGKKSTVESDYGALAKGIGTAFYNQGGNTSLYKRFLGQASSALSGFSDGVDSNGDTLRSKAGTLSKGIGDKFYTPSKISLYDRFKTFAHNSVSGYADGINEDTGERSWFDKTIISWADRIKSSFEKQLEIGSPSKVFHEFGKYSVEGYNQGIAVEGQATKGIVQKWADSFTHIPAAFAMDTSAIDSYDPGSYLSDVQTQVANHSSLSVDGVSQGMETFFVQMLQPMLQQIADDTRRQADKNEQTVVTLDGRVLTRTVERQQRANGFRFVPA